MNTTHAFDSKIKFSLIGINGLASGVGIHMSNITFILKLKTLSFPFKKEELKR